MFQKISGRLLGMRKRKELADQHKGLADQRKALSDSARMAQSIVEICSFREPPNDGAKAPGPKCRGKNHQTKLIEEWRDLEKLRKEREKFLNPYLAPSTITEVLKLPREEIPILRGTDDLSLYDLGLFIEEYRIFDNIWISKKELFDQDLLPRPITETKLASSETPQATKEQQLDQDVNEQAASDTKALSSKVIPKGKVDSYLKSAGPLALVSTKPTDSNVHSTPMIPKAKVDNHFKAAGPLPLVATKPSDPDVHPKVSSAIVSKAKVEHHNEAARRIMLAATKAAESKAQSIWKMYSERPNEDPATIIFIGYGGHRYILPFESCRL
ncbi:hypothetical protein V8F06_006968 [Rhypophila decipiens]